LAAWHNARRPQTRSVPGPVIGYGGEPARRWWGQLPL